MTGMVVYTHVAVALLASAVGFYGAWQVQGWRWRAADADRMDQQREVRRGQDAQADSAAVRHEETRASLRAQQRALTREVEHVVEVPLYRGECLDSDGLRLIADALGQPPSPADFTAAVPASSPSR